MSRILYGLVILLLNVWNVQYVIGDKLNYIDYAQLHKGLVHIRGSSLRGIKTASIREGTWNAWQFSNIRYATAERFEQPKLFDDYSRAPSDLTVCCPAKVFNGTITKGLCSEDCLMLTISLPLVNHEQERLQQPPWPVLMTIGSLDEHTGPDELFRAEQLALGADAVVVSIQHRNGLFGFFSTDDYNARGNWGLKDIKMSLKWIKQYIHRFGADPDRIILCAFAPDTDLVPYLLADRWFRETISGVLIVGGEMAEPTTVNLGLENAIVLSDAVGCKSNETTEQIVECLLKMTTEELLEADAKLGNLTWKPTVTGLHLLGESGWQPNGGSSKPVAVLVPHSKSTKCCLKDAAAPLLRCSPDTSTQKSTNNHDCYLLIHGLVNEPNESIPNIKYL